MDKGEKKFLATEVIANIVNTHHMVTEIARELLSQAHNDLCQQILCYANKKMSRQKKTPNRPTGWVKK